MFFFNARTQGREGAKMKKLAAWRPCAFALNSLIFAGFFAIGWQSDYCRASGVKSIAQNVMFVPAAVASVSPKFVTAPLIATVFVSSIRIRRFCVSPTLYCGGFCPINCFNSISAAVSWLGI